LVTWHCNRPNGSAKHKKERRGTSERREKMKKKKRRNGVNGKKGPPRGGKSEEKKGSENIDASFQFRGDPGEKSEERRKRRIKRGLNKLKRRGGS